MTRRPARPARALLLLGALALVGAALGGCSSRGDGGPTALPRPAGTGAAASSSVAAELRAGLTFLYTERAHLFAAAARALQTSGGRRDDSAVRTAADHLDANTVAVADALGAAYPDAGPAVLPRLRQLDRLMLDHTAAQAAGDPAAVEAAVTALAAGHDELAEEVQRVAPPLLPADVARSSRTDTDGLLDVGAAVVDGDPAQFTLLRDASERAPATAALLADGLEPGEQAAGSLTAGQLRSELTGLLAEQVWLAGGLATVLAEGQADPRAPLPAAAVAAMEGNARALSETFGAAYPTAELSFLSAFQTQLQALTAYAQARAAGQTGDRQRARLESFPGQLGTVLERELPALTASRTAAELAPAVASLVAGVDSAAAGDPESTGDLRRAAADVPAPAALMAAAVSEDLGLA